MANPSNWEELAYTINQEYPFMDYDPNSPPDHSDLLSLF